MATAIPLEALTSLIEAVDGIREALSATEEEEQVGEAAPEEEVAEEPAEVSEREAKLMALLKAKYPDGIDVEEELASVYKSPKSGEYVYREAPTPAPEQPTGAPVPKQTATRIAPLKNGTGRKPGYSVEGKPMITIADQIEV